MSSFETLKAKEEQILFSTYSRFPLAVKRAEGCRLYDFEGREYVDLLSGIAVASVGHCNPEVAEAIYKQAQKLVHVSNVFYQEEQTLLAEALLKTTGGAMGRAFFCNSGAEANEAAIKLARRWQQKVRGKDAYEVISLTGCFHGRTLAALAATGQAKYQDGFHPMPAGFKQAAPNDLRALEEAITPQTAAVILEVIQGEGGVKPLDRQYLLDVARLCHDKGILVIADEVQTGLCRTGKWWGFQHFQTLGFEPDIITSAKALANGLPMGAMMGRAELGAALQPGSHASTFGGNALASAAALAVLNIMERDKLADRAATIGEWAKKRFAQLAVDKPGHIVDIRGSGLLLGIELAYPGKTVWEKLLQRGFVVNLTQDKTLRVIPPLTIPLDDLENFAQTLEDILDNGAAQ